MDAYDSTPSRSDARAMIDLAGTPWILERRKVFDQLLNRHRRPPFVDEGRTGTTHQTVRANLPFSCVAPADDPCMNFTQLWLPSPSTAPPALRPSRPGPRSPAPAWLPDHSPSLRPRHQTAPPCSNANQVDGADRHDALSCSFFLLADHAHSRAGCRLDRRPARMFPSRRCLGFHHHSGGCQP